MRPLEISIAVLILITVIAKFFPALSRKSIFAALTYGAGIIMPVHLVVEGYRWQMLPLFILVFGLITERLYWYYYFSKKEFIIGNKTLRKIYNILILALFIISIAFPILLPVVNLPEPAGPYSIGVKDFRMVDYNRNEIFTKDPDDCRNLLVTAWYPAVPNKRASLRTYWDKKGIMGKKYSINAGMGKFWYTHLKLSKTNSYHEAPLSENEEAFPVVIYSPSFYGLNSENTMLMEELASNGYVVFSIAHSYETIVSVFPEGEVVPGDLSHISTLFDSNAEKEMQLYEKYNMTDNNTEKTELIKQILVVDELSNQIIRIRKEDVVFVLNEIEKLNSNGSIFNSKLDLERVGVMGWSFGGAAAIEVCLTDNRFKAGINIDGWPYGDLFNTGKAINQPFMIIRSDYDNEMENIISNLVFDKTANSAYILKIENTTHINFWDFPLFFKVYKYIGYWGTIDPLKLLEIEHVYLTGFFNRYLKGENATIPEELSDLFPEVTVQAKNTKVVGE